MADHTAIKVSNVGKIFRLPHEKNTSIKGAVIDFWHRDRTYEKQQVLKDISFEVKKGEFFGIVGRNGSGKSTLLKILAGIYSPSAGDVQLNGRLTPFIELGVGFSPELTGRENVFLNGALLGFNRQEMKAMYKDIVKFAELERFMDQKLKNYSSGMQVRLAFSIAIRAKSDILLIDEVLAVGDEAFQKKCAEYFREVKNSGQTVVLVTHDMKAVNDYCDKAMLISEGEIVLLKDPATVAAAYSELNRSSLNDQPIDLVADKDSIQAGAKISQVLTRDPTTKKTKRYFKYGEEVEIVVKYELLDAVKKGIIDIGVKPGRNATEYFYTTSDEQDIWITGQKGTTVELTCKFKNIFNGSSFYIATSLYDPKTLKTYARERQAAKFETGELPTGGMVLPDYTLTLNEDE